MKIVLVRHGEPDYSKCVEKGYIGHGFNLAPLSEKGRLQAEQVAHSEYMKDAQLVVSSPYTRALQTAAAICSANRLPLLVDEELHEWIPDLTYQNTQEDEKKSSDDFLACGGIWPEGTDCKWESIHMLSQRVLNALDRYRDYDKIIVVCHAVVMFHLTGLNTVPHCCTAQIDYDNNFKPCGWFSKNDE